METEHSATATHPGSPEARPATDDGGAASLEKVRDILFGAQVRDTDRRFARLEELIARETNELREDVRKRLGAIEQYVKHEFESLAERLKDELDARTAADTELSRVVRDLSEVGERRFGQIDDQVARVQRELRQQLLEAQQQLHDEMQQQAQEHAARVTRESSVLRADKLDRAEFAAALTEIAMRMTDRLSTGAHGE